MSGCVRTHPLAHSTSPWTTAQCFLSPWPIRYHPVLTCYRDSYHLLLHLLAPPPLNPAQAAGYSAPIASKEQLLLVTGLRSFTARPVLSTDDPGADKHRTEKFLHAGGFVSS